MFRKLVKNWQRFTGTSQDLSDVRALRVYLVKLSTVVAVLLVLLYTGLTLFNWQFEDPHAAWYGPALAMRTFVTLLACGATYILARPGWVYLAPIPILGVVFLQFASVSLVNPYNSALALWIVIGVVMGIILHGGWVGALVLVGFLLWQGLVMIGWSAEPKLSSLLDEFITGSIVWVLTWISTYRVSRQLADSLKQVRKANQQLEREHDKLTAILSGMTDGVLAIDFERRVLLVNDAARRLLGLGSARVVGKPLADVVDSLIVCFDQAANLDKVMVDELTFEGRTLQINVSQVREVGWVAVMQDITYLKELEQVRADFMATATHDLKNPINVVNGSVDLLLVKGDLNDFQRRYLERIRHASDNMLNLVSDLLEIARLEADRQLPVEKVDPEWLLQAALDDVRAQFEQCNHALRLEAAPASVLLYGDASSLKRVLVNLLNNAAKYTPEGGEVIVRTEINDGFMCFEVVDNGIGIAPEYQARIFERFYRVESKQTLDIEGTGLGLTIVKAIIEQHGGEVWVQSEPGQGSIFGFKVPLAVESASVLAG